MNNHTITRTIAVSALALAAALASPAWADATPECNFGAGYESTECGANSVASGGGSTATGHNSSASGDFGTATGRSSTASGAGSTATGAGSTASGIDSTATGAGSTASGLASTATGADSSASGINSTATGQSSVASGTNSAALGAGAIADQDDTVSVGHGGAGFIGPATRRIVNVTAGIADTDAVNVAQLNTVIAVNTLQDNRLTAIEALNMTQSSQIAALQSLTANHTAQIADLYDVTDLDRRDARRGTAVAIAEVPAAMPSAPGRTSYSFNLANFRGEQAAGLSLAHRFNSDTPFALTAGASYAGGRSTAVRVGVAGEF